MMNSQVTQEIASLTIGSDLRAGSPNAAWRGLNLPGGNGQTRERIDRLFPESDVAGYVLDVLASGVPSENLAVRISGDGEERFLWASFHPYPSAAKPKNVLMQVQEMSAHLLVDGKAGEVLEANAAAKEMFGQTPRSPGSPWFAEPLQSQETRAVSFAQAAQCGSHYLGKFKHRRPDGSVVELESILVPVDGPQNSQAARSLRQ
jgi:hypothetical protein